MLDNAEYDVPQWIFLSYKRKGDTVNVSPLYYIDNVGDYMNKKTINILLPLVILFSALVEAEEGRPITPYPTTYENGSRLDYEACRILVRRGEILPMSDLMALGKQRSSDHVLDAYLIKQNDRYYYQIESVGDNGVVNNFYMDASNGEVMTDFKVSQ
ncbi:hypothetical protein SAMN05216175_101464 [Neptunomonas qingdaonensis]|uniref:Peptidase propeptide and YPEB domain-containing protein n=2 Tax=Neptunomonas qingdaonensis TaxID=1045558 RepID=A0A1I2M8K5_9GAMM|nr:hypothetical protein SAMN05216175_101464 [Neptunomonas qingdaonensis]